MSTQSRMWKCLALPVLVLFVTLQVGIWTTLLAADGKPATTLRRGIVKATIWENTSKNRQFFSTTFSRSYKERSGAWRNGTSFGLNDLEALLSGGFPSLTLVATR